MARKKGVVRSGASKGEAKAPTSKASKPSKFEQLLGKFNDAYGFEREGEKEKAPVIVMADKSPDLLRVPVGILGLDYIMGSGVPISRVLGISGWESDGKSTLASLIMRAFQRVCPICYYIGCHHEDRPVLKTLYLDPEKTYDKEWNHILGVDNRHVALCQPDYAEQGIDIVDAAIRSNEFGLVIVDTIAALTPAKEIEKSSEDGGVGLQPRKINEGIRKWSSAMNSRGVMDNMGCTVITVNQYRLKIGVTFGNPQTLPGGMGQLFFPSIMLELGKGAKGIDDGDKMLNWVETKVKCRKNKTAPARGVGKYRLTIRDYSRWKAGQLQEEGPVLEMGVEFGVISEQKGKWSFPGVLDDSFTSKKGFVEELQTHQIPTPAGEVFLWDLLYSKIMTAWLDHDRNRFRLFSPECRISMEGTTDVPAE